MLNWLRMDLGNAAKVTVEKLQKNVSLMLADSLLGRNSGLIIFSGYPRIDDHVNDNNMRA